MKETFYSSVKDTLLSKNSDYTKKITERDKKKIKAKSHFEKIKETLHAKNESSAKMYCHLKDQKQASHLMKKELHALKHNLKLNNKNSFF